MQGAHTGSETATSSTTSAASNGTIFLFNDVLEVLVVEGFLVFARKAFLPQSLQYGSFETFTISLPGPLNVHPHVVHTNLS